MAKITLIIDDGTEVVVERGHELRAPLSAGLPPIGTKWELATGDEPLISGRRRRRRKEPGPLVTQAAQEIKTELSGSFITVILPILTTLLPLLLGLCKKPTPEEQQKAAIAAWDGERYSRFVLTSSTRRARHAAKLEGERLSRDEAEEVAVRSLDKIRLADPETFSATWHEIEDHPDTQLLLASYDSEI